MADYYTTKAKAVRMIDDLFAENKPIEVIEFKLMTKFGFDKKLILKRLKQHADMKEIASKDKDGIHKTKKE